MIIVYGAIHFIRKGRNEDNSSDFLRILNERFEEFLAINTQNLPTEAEYRYFKLLDEVTGLRKSS